MDQALIPIALGLLSAITLAAVNTAIKSSGDVLMSRALHMVGAALMMAPCAFFVPLPTREVWLALAIALPAHWLYEFALVKTLTRGDLSLVFPIMRGSAPLLVAGAAYLVLGEALSTSAMAGLAVVTFSVIAFALPPKGIGLHNHPSKAALFWACITAIGIAAYTVLDTRGVRLAANPVTFIVWLFIVDWVFIATIVAIRRRGALLHGLRTQWRYGFGSAAGSIISFGAAMLALDMMEAAKVSALRETSVVFAALFGWHILKEGFGLRRTLAALALACGLALMQVG